jgi:putative transposase
MPAIQSVEVHVTINGVSHSLWRAVDHDGGVPESPVTKTRARKAALKFLRKSIKWLGWPENVVTDRLCSFSAALKDLGRGDDLDRGRWINTRARNPHLRFRRRERAKVRVRRMRRLRTFASAHASVNHHVPTARRLQNYGHSRHCRAAALAAWRSHLVA